MLPDPEQFEAMPPSRMLFATPMADGDFLSHYMAKLLYSQTIAHTCP
jgi:hypothetical protein